MVRHVPDAQEEVIAFLSTPAAYGLTEGPVERVDTHISIVWLAGARAYKLKRAVAYDYVDFSSLEARHAACDAEVRLNRRTAPTLYVGTRAVTRERDGRLALAGHGEPLEWLVEMVRFDQETLFDRLAERHELDLALMEPLADAIADLHAVAEVRRDRGGRDGMAWVVDGNARAFDSLVKAEDRPLANSVVAAARAAVDRVGGLLDARRRQGAVRWCHGDLHLRNIFLLNGQPTLFDAIEFSERIACIDVLYDLAFLLMDLWRRDLRRHANAVFNRYCGRTDAIDGVSLLPLFLSSRAAVRAKTSATAAHMQDESRATALWGATREYLRLAETLLRPAKPHLLAIGGFSGSGKSTLARHLAPNVGAAPGALILRSDVIRKQQHGVAPLTRLGSDAYTPSVNRRVYATIAERARAALAGGHSVIADAVYGRVDERRAIAAVAKEVGVPFHGIWLDVSPDVLRSRLAARERDASDATVAVLDRQIATGAGDLDWVRVDGSAETETVERAMQAIISEAGV